MNANSGVLVLGESKTFAEATAACASLGEAVWQPSLKTASIKPNLDYLVYQGKATPSTRFWIASADAKPQTISAAGTVADAGANDTALPALCTQTAPFSNETFTDTSPQWQVSLTANNETLTG